MIRDSLAGLVLGIKYSDLPADVVVETKRIVLDTLGCALGGLSEDAPKAVRAMIGTLGGVPEATVIGSGEKTSCTMATFANGTALRYLDTNDYYFGRDPAHASGNLAAILAVGERMKSSGADVLAAYVAAYEIQFRLCDFAGSPNLWDRGWHHATNMSFASAAAAAKLLGLNQAQIAEALAIAGTHGNILTESMRGKMASIKATIEAVAAKGGVEAALMAAGGLTGPEKIFEGEYGWGRAVAGELDVAGLTAPMSGHYGIMKARIKPFPAFAPSQGLIQAALDIYNKHRPRVEDIAAIEGRFPEQIFKWPTADDQKTMPTNREMADHSPLYLMAVVLMDGQCSPAQFSATRLKDPALHSLMSKARMVPDPAMSKYYSKATGAAVTVTMKDGQKFEVICPIPPGHPENRLDAAAMERKFRGYAEPQIGAAASGCIIDAVDKIESFKDIRDFMRLLAA